MTGSNVDNKLKAIDILSNYNGKNSYILSVKNSVCVYGKTDELSDFSIDYVIRNNSIEPKPINKLVSISDWYGQKLQNEYNISFTPLKLQILVYFGDTELYYHCFVKYKQNMEPIKIFLPKRGVLTNFLLDDFNNLQLDFSWFDKKLKEINTDWSVMEHQKTAVKFLLSRKKCILSLDMGLGKMEPVSSLIPTPNGFKRMGNIRVGDKVFGSDGKEHNVIEIFPHKNKDIYKVEFTDGTSAECGLEHLWLVRTASDRLSGKDWKTMSLKEILDRGLYFNDESRVKKGLNQRPKFQIPICEPVDYPEREYLIHPYILGMCIGDGNLCSGSIHISIPDIEREDADRISSLLQENMTLVEDRSANCPRYRIKEKVRKLTNPYIQEIKRLNLNVNGNYKFIPEEYKLGSISQRIDLLRGLMDSDGSISKTRNKIGYYTNSEKLADDVIELVNSLGGIARKHCYHRIKNEIDVYEYVVSIQIKLNPFYLKRKAERYNPTFKKYCSRYIKSATLIRKEDAQCISVDSDNHSYITGRSYIVTHNTMSSIIASLMYGNKKVLVICPASIKTNWKNELSRFVSEDNINIIKGFDEMNKQELVDFLEIQDKNQYKVDELREMAKERGKWKEGKQFTILNFDIIDEFHKNTRKKNDDSELLKSDFDIVIIDEAHKLSNNTSNRFKVIRNYLKKAKNEYTWLLTGTMVTNDVKNLYNMLSLIENDITGDYDYFMKRYCDAKKILRKGEWDRCWRIWNKGHNASYSSMSDSSKKMFRDFTDRVGKHVTLNNGASNLDELNERINHLYFRMVKEDIMTTKKQIIPIAYTLTPEEKQEYDRLWDEYEKEKLSEGVEVGDIKQLIEISVNRQYISKIMVKNTIELTDKLISNGKKVFIICCFDEELYTLQEHYGKKCVIFNGKMNQKQKDNSVDEFNNNPDVMILIGQIKACGVGINLNKSCNHAIFQNLSFTDAEFSQACDRIYRIGSKEDAFIYLQYYKNTVSEHTVEIITRKKQLSEQIINNN